MNIHKEQKSSHNLERHSLHQCCVSYILKKSGPSFCESSKNSGGSPAEWVSIDSAEEQKPPLKISKLKLNMHGMLKISCTGENVFFSLTGSLTKSVMLMF